LPLSMLVRAKPDEVEEVVQTHCAGVASVRRRGKDGASDLARHSTLDQSAVRDEGALALLTDHDGAVEGAHVVVPVHTRGNVPHLLIVLRLLAHVLRTRHVELPRQLGVPRADLVVRPRPVPVPLTRDEQRALDLEGEHHRLEWAGMPVAHEIVNEARVCALALSCSPVSIVGHSRVAHYLEVAGPSRWLAV